MNTELKNPHIITTSNVEKLGYEISNLVIYHNYKLTNLEKDGTSWIATLVLDRREEINTYTRDYTYLDEMSGKLRK